MTWFRIALACIVIGVWVAGYVIAYVSGGDRPEELTFLMVMIVGWALGSEAKHAVKRWIKGDDDAPEG